MVLLIIKMEAGSGKYCSVRTQHAHPVLYLSFDTDMSVTNCKLVKTRLFVCLLAIVSILFVLPTVDHTVAVTIFYVHVHKDFVAFTW